MSNKDWIGNKQSSYSTIGASNHSSKDREENDFYATDPYAIDCLINGGGIIATDVWECSCGAGHLSKRLEEFGHNVLSTDLVDRGYGIGGVDFLLCEKTWDGDILTNPPYKYATEFTLHALDLIHPGSKVFMFLKLTFLESSKRRRLFDTKQLKTVYVFSKRILCAKNGDFRQMIADGGSAVAYAWFEFEKGYCGDPIIKWVN